MINPRLVAVKWLVRVVEKGRSVNELLSPGQVNQAQQELNPQQRSLAKQCLFGCLRYYHQLNTVANTLLSKPFKPKDTDLAMVVILGLYQLKYLSTPDHAAISESVELTRSLNKSWASAVVNGVLRRYQRESAIIEEN